MRHKKEKGNVENYIEERSFWMVVDEKGNPTPLNTKTVALFIQSSFAEFAAEIASTEMFNNAIKTHCDVCWDKLNGNCNGEKGDCLSRQDFISALGRNAGVIIKTE